jgi:hypothetical protein
MSAKVALQLNAAVGLASTAAAGALISMVMTDPAAVALAIARHEYGAVAMAVAHQLAGWLHALLRFI